MGAHATWTAETGNAAWRLLHSTVYQLAEPLDVCRPDDRLRQTTLSLEKLDDFENMVRGLLALYPCGVCRENLTSKRKEVCARLRALRKEVALRPGHVVEMAALWVFRFHNYISKSLGKCSGMLGTHATYALEAELERGDPETRQRILTLLCELYMEPEDGEGAGRCPLA